MSTVDDNKAVAVAWLDMVSDGDVDGLIRCSTPEWRLYGGPPDLPAGPAGLRALFAEIGSAEQTWTVDDVIAEADRVVVRATNNCIQKSFMGVPADGVRQVFTATFTMRMHDGKVAETWCNADDLGRLLQLGARIVPPEPLTD